jgi:tRNA 2-selenouridine synthase
MPLPDFSSNPSEEPSIAPGPELFDPAYVVLDVRAPAEFSKGHIPGAVSLHLFDDAERAEIGTLYKQRGEEAAVELGLEHVGPRMAELVRRAREAAEGKRILVHCWRGGMRSGAVVWLLKTAGLPVEKLVGGYKAYRAWMRASLAAPRPYHIVGGMTGVGKTDVLNALSNAGAQTLDLEGLAAHFGSAFGNLDQHAQPTTEQFANDVHAVLFGCDLARPIWVEDESRRIGNVVLPDELYDRLVAAPIWSLDRSNDERIARLCRLYGEASPSSLIAAFERIRKRLGGLTCDQAIAAVSAGDLPTATRLVLPYYDKQYRHTMAQSEALRTAAHHLEITGLPEPAIARQLISSSASTPPTP